VDVATSIAEIDRPDRVGTPKRLSQTGAKWQGIRCERRLDIPTTPMVSLNFKAFNAYGAAGGIRTPDPRFRR